MTINNQQYPKYLKNYFSIIYVGALFLIIGIAGTVGEFKSDELLQCIIFGLLTLMWSWILLLSFINFCKLVKARLKKLEYITIKEIKLFSLLEGREISSREFKWLMVFTTLVYMTVPIMIIAKN
tara:strand:- start:121 stop:492 length:372 start_codon:yes stop_codon:yes gene_type:complete